MFSYSPTTLRTHHHFPTLSFFLSPRSNAGISTDLEGCMETRGASTAYPQHGRIHTN